MNPDGTRFVARRPSASVSGGPMARMRRGRDGGYPSEFGPLADLVADPAVTDVFVNGRDGTWADRGSGVERVDDVMLAEPELRSLAVHLLALGNRHIDESKPNF